MAFTIRHLSPEAEKQIEILQQESEYINTKSKAIERALCSLPNLKARIHYFEKENRELKAKVKELEEIKLTLKHLKKLIK